MKRRRKWRKYEVPGYIYDALRQLRPPEDLLPSEWAERYRRLDSKTSAIPGPWRNSMTPYLVGIMDEMVSYDTQRVIFCKPTQCGGTECLANYVGYEIQQDPAPMMIVYPTQELAESISVNRIQPMIRLCQPLKDLWDEKRSKKLELQFEGMYLTLVGSNSPSGLASKACKIVALDEVDKFPETSGKEADPIKLAIERTKTYRNSKVLITSTPTLSTGHIWRALQACDCEKHYFVPCPHCGEFIELKWSNLKFPGKDTDDGVTLTPSERADQAVYVCQECGGVIQDCHKMSMLQAGEWRAVREVNKVHRSVGFWLNTLYSPFVRFSEMALEFLRSKGDPSELQNFVNSWLAEPWEDTRLKTSAQTVLEHQTETPEFEVPEWARFLTGGVDVQETSLYWTIRAWGNHITSQNICHGQADSWADIERVMNLPYRKAGGKQMIVSLCLIDSGFNTDSTYDFCADHSDWAAPAKGDSENMYTSFRLAKVNRVNSRAYGMNLVLVNGGQYKDMIAARMRKEIGTGSWMVYQGCDEEYAQQVTAEHKINVRSGNKTIARWVQKHSHADNHYLDCEVYAMCAADMMGVRSMHLDEEDEALQRAKDEPKQPEESWIYQMEGSWL